MNESTVKQPALNERPIQIYPVQQWYLVSAAVCLGLGLVFVWQLAQGFEAGAALFLGICVGGALWQWRAARTQIALAGDRLVVAAPWSSQREIEFRQMLTVVQEGRVNPTLLVMYHPCRPDGLMDLDDVRSVTLPAVQDQPALLDRLEGHIPR